MSRASILMVPGWTNSGPDHWQSHWEYTHADYRRIQQDDWERPRRATWLQNIGAAIAETDSPIVLVGHSLGCVAVADWAASADPAATRRIGGAFLVAPADIEREDAPEVLHSWRPMPLARMPFPSLLVASRNDDSASFARSEVFARAWGSRLIDAGEAGHIHTAAGYGPWLEGHGLLHEFAAQLLTRWPNQAMPLTPSRTAFTPSDD